MCAAQNVMRKPSHLSWVEAASVPENWLTGLCLFRAPVPAFALVMSPTQSFCPAFQALILIAECKPGDDVLIHAGASGVGVR